MRVLYISQYFAPEVGATQTRAYEMATGLIRAGHQVTMLTEVPNHPEGVIRPGYRGRLWMRDDLDGIDVIRVWVKTSPTKTLGTRLAFYLSFALNAALAGLICARGDYDVIYVTSPPLFVGLPALILSVLRHVPLVFEVRDLWPESAVALGELQNPFAIRVATVLEKACYRRARRVVAVTRGIHDRLLERDIPARKVSWIPNGANTELFRPRPTVGAERRKELGLGGKFVAIYAGIHGIAQALETVLYAADRLKGNTDIHFLFIGDGPRKRDLVRLAEELRLPNVTMLDSQPRETIPGYLSAANIALVPLRDEELFKGAVPSKIFDAWACARPVLLGIDGEAREILERAQAGRYVEPESVEALVRAVSELSTHPDLCREYGANGRRFVVEHYSRQAQARQLVQLLESI